MNSQIKTTLSNDMDEFKLQIIKSLSSKAHHADVENINQVLQAVLIELKQKATKDDLVPYLRKIETFEFEWAQRH